LNLATVIPRWTGCLRGPRLLQQRRLPCVARTSCQSGPWWATGVRSVLWGQGSTYGVPFQVQASLPGLRSLCVCSQPSSFTCPPNFVGQAPRGILGSGQCPKLHHPRVESGYSLKFFQRQQLQTGTDRSLSKLGAS